MTEYDHEPIRGLPGDLPAGEEILWQGSPDWRTFARSALYTRYIAGYFAILALFGIASGSMFGAVTSVVAGVIVHALLALFATIAGIRLNVAASGTGESVNTARAPVFNRIRSRICRPMAPSRIRKSTRWGPGSWSTT